MKLDRYPNIDERGRLQMSRLNSIDQNDRCIVSVLLYAKQENEEVFHPLHLVPPTLVGLALAVSIVAVFIYNELLMYNVPFFITLRSKTSTNWKRRILGIFTNDARKGKQLQFYNCWFKIHTKLRFCFRFSELRCKWMTIW